MTILAINSFAGEIPRLPADRLPDGAAQLARNVNFAHGELRPLAALGDAWAAHSSACPVRAAFTDNGLRWFAWNLPTRAYLAPTIDDTAGRVYYQTHGAGIRVAQTSTMRLSSLEPRPPTESWKAGLKVPAGLVATPVGTPTGTLETRAYVAVAVNIWGEESAPSAPVMVDVEPGQQVNLSITHVADPDQVALDGIVFYRTYADTPDFFLIQETSSALVLDVAILSDSTEAPQTTTTLQSAQWDPPPIGAGNLTYIGNGFFAASSGKDLVVSAPYRPHAWPYRMTFPHGIVGVIEVEGGALVTTQAQTYLVYGAHPTQLSQQALPAEQAGWSDTSMARVNGSAVFASNDGLVAVFGGQPSLDNSQELFTRKDWRARYGSARLNLRFGQHDGRLIGLVDPSHPIAATADAFVLRLDEAGGELCRLDVGQMLYSMSVSGTTDEMYVGTATGAAVFAGSATPLAYAWHSGDVLYPMPISFGAALIDCTGSVTVEILADGVVIHSEAVTGELEFRLPDVGVCRRWSIRLTGTAIVRKVCLGASFTELQQA